MKALELLENAQEMTLRKDGAKEVNEGGTQGLQSQGQEGVKGMNLSAGGCGPDNPRMSGYASTQNTERTQSPEPSQVSLPQCKVSGTKCCESGLYQQEVTTTMG